MKNPNFIVRVPEPCHEDWQSMRPDEKGKFCKSCSKPVFDFSNKTDTEVKDILVAYKDQKVCGHFKKSQINRPLNISFNLKDLPKNVSITKAFAIALFLVFGTVLFSCTDKHGHKIDDIKVIDTVLVENVDPNNYMAGMIIADIPRIDSIPPICTTVSGTMMSTGLAVSGYVINDDHIEGEISVEDIPGQAVSPLKEDTVVTDESVMEMHVLGQMISPYIDELDSSNSGQNKSVNHTRKIIGEHVISTPESFGIYPNPGNGEFTIKYNVLNRSNVRVDVFNIKGALLRTIVDVLNQHEGKYQIPVNLSELPNGIYLVSLIINGKKSVERLVIER
jgi:hypothetical protein